MLFWHRAVKTQHHEAEEAAFCLSLNRALLSHDFGNLHKLSVKVTLVATHLNSARFMEGTRAPNAATGSCGEMMISIVSKVSLSLPAPVQWSEVHNEACIYIWATDYAVVLAVLLLFLLQKCTFFSFSLLVLAFVVSAVSCHVSIDRMPALKRVPALARMQSVLHVSSISASCALAPRACDVACGTARLTHPAMLCYPAAAKVSAYLFSLRFALKHMRRKDRVSVLI